MPTYIVLGNFTDQGIRAVRDSLKREDAFRKQCEKVGAQIWDAVKQVVITDLTHFPLTMTVGSFTTSVKVNNKGAGTCSALDVDDPATGQRKDGIKDQVCQFPTSGFPEGLNYAIVQGFFTVTGEDVPRAFRARQLVNIIRNVH